MSDSTEDKEMNNNVDGRNSPSLAGPRSRAGRRGKHHYEKQEQKEEEKESLSYEFKRRNKHPDALYDQNRKKIKMEQDFRPVFGPKKEPVSNDVQSPTLTALLDFQKEKKNKQFSAPSTSASVKNRKETKEINFLQVLDSFYQLPIEDAKKSTSVQDKKFLSEVSAIKNLSWNDHRDFQILNNLNIKWSQIERIESKLNQHEIETEENKKALVNLLKSCTNLKLLNFPPLDKVNYFSSSLIEICTSLNKNEKLTISNLAVSVANAEDMEKIQKFAETKIRILNLTLWICFSPQLKISSLQTTTLTKAVEKILESSNNTMTDLTVFDSSVEAFLSTLKFPRMSRLKSLKLPCFTVSDGHSKFGEGFQFSINFPYLTDLDLDFVADGNFLESTPFDHFRPARSVKKLKFSCNSLPKKMLEIFPEIEELELSKIDNPISSLSFIWEISTKLKKLKLGIPDPNPDSLVQFISTLSGFTMETVQNLLDFPDDMTADFKKPNLSLFDLPELEYLTFIGTKEAFKEFRSSGFWILRKLTLDLMPDLILKFRRRSDSTIPQKS